MIKMNTLTCIQGVASYKEKSTFLRTANNFTFVF